jgi:prevent-host-death family protein
MNTVGIRELKSRLTHYVRLVKQGQNVILTERGKPVAILHGLEERAQTREGRLASLAAQGRILLPSTPRERPRRVRTKRPIGLARAILEDRATD